MRQLFPARCLGRLASESLMSTMSTLQQACPSCNRQLELPASALGRLAKCPACEAIFTVTVSADVSVDQGRPQSAPPAAPPRSVPPTPPPSEAPPDSPTNNPSNQFETPQSGFEALPENRRAGPASPEEQRHRCTKTPTLSARRWRRAWQLICQRMPITRRPHYAERRGR